LANRFKKIVDVSLKIGSKILGDLLEGRRGEIESGTFAEELLGFVAGHETHGEQDGISNFAGGELIFHVPSVVEWNETLAVCVLVQASGEDGFAEGRLELFLAGAIELIFLTLVDESVVAGLVLFEIGFEPFGTGGEDGGLEDVDHMFGIVEGQGLSQLVAVILQNVLDFGDNRVYNSCCLQGKLLS